MLTDGGGGGGGDGSCDGSGDDDYDHHDDNKLHFYSANIYANEHIRTLSPLSMLSNIQMLIISVRMSV